MKNSEGISPEEAAENAGFMEIAEYLKGRG